MQPQTIRRSDGSVETTATTPVSGRGRSRSAGSSNPVTNITHTHRSNSMMAEVELAGSGDCTIFALAKALREEQIDGKRLMVTRDGHRLQVRYSPQLSSRAVEDMINMLARSC